MKNKYLETMIENADITINTCRANTHAAGDAFSLGKTKDCDLLIITAGEYEYTIDGRQYRVPAGDLFLVPDKCVFSGRALADSAHYYCHFTLNLPLKLREGNQIDAETRNLFLTACQSPDHDFLLRCVIRIILYKHALAGNAALSPRIPAGILSAVEEMETHPQRNITAAELANIADMSYGYFFKCFKKAMGVSPIQYRDQLRLAEGRRLILSGMSIKETAMALHFADMFAFSKRFKQQYHIAPSKVKGLNHPPV